MKKTFTCLFSFAIMATAFAFPAANADTTHLNQTVTPLAENISTQDAPGAEKQSKVFDDKVLVAPAIICRPGPVPGSPTPRICNRPDIDAEADSLQANIERQGQSGAEKQSQLLDDKNLVAPSIITCRPGPVPGSPTPRVCNRVDINAETDLLQASIERQGQNPSYS